MTTDVAPTSNKHKRLSGRCRTVNHTRRRPDNSNSVDEHCRGKALSLRRAGTGTDHPSHVIITVGHLLCSSDFRKTSEARRPLASDETDYQSLVVGQFRTAGHLLCHTSHTTSTLSDKHPSATMPQASSHEAHKRVQCFSRYESDDTNAVA